MLRTVAVGDVPLVRSVRRRRVPRRERWSVVTGDVVVTRGRTSSTLDSLITTR